MVTASEKLNEMYSEETCASAIGFIRAKALMRDEIKSDEIHIRIAYVYDEIYYDLGRADWKLIKISKDGISFVPLLTGTGSYQQDRPIF